MSKRLTANLTAMALSRSLLILMTRPCTNYIYGKTYTYSSSCNY